MAVQFNTSNSRPRTASSERDVNTTSFILKNRQLNKFMMCGYWNRCMSLDIGDVPNGQPMSFDVMRTVKTTKQSISYSTIFELKEVCDEVIRSVEKTGNFEPTGIKCGSNYDCMIEISNGSNIDAPNGIYLVIYKNIDQATNKTNNVNWFAFGQAKMIKNYDHLTGQCVDAPIKMGEFKKFAMFVNEAAKAFTLAQAHASLDIHKSDKFNIFRSLAAIATANGIDMSKEYTPKSSAQFTARTGSSGEYQKRSWNNNLNYKNKLENGYSNSNFGGYNDDQNNYQAENISATPMDDNVDITLDVNTLDQVPFENFS